MTPLLVEAQSHQLDDWFTSYAFASESQDGDADRHQQPCPDPAGQRPGTLRIYWENDGTVHDPFDSYDRHYTNGFAVVLEHQPQWAGDVAGFMPFAGAFDQRHGLESTGAGYVLSQLLFTPNNLAAAAPITTDRPYAGYMYGGVFWQRAGQYERREDAAVFDHFEVNIGLVGSQALGEDIQEWVHANFEGVDPQGWDNQLANEVTFQFFYRRKWRFDIGSFDSRLLGGLDMQLIPQLGVALGTVYRHGEAGVVFRIGHQLPDDFGPGRINDLQAATGDVYANDGWSWYAYARIGGRAVEHELFLDGSTRSNPSLSVPRETLVGEVQAGLAISCRYSEKHRFDLTWGLTYYTDTFDAPGDRGTHSYGTFVLSWVRSF